MKRSRSLTRLEKQSGTVLLMVMVCVMIMTLFAGMMIEPVRSEVTMAVAAKSEATAFYAAEAGVEMAVADLLRSDDPAPKNSFKLGAASVSYEIVKQAGKQNHYLVTARGSVPGLSANRTVVEVVMAEVAIHVDQGRKRAEVVCEHVRR